MVEPTLKIIISGCSSSTIEESDLDKKIEIVLTFHFQINPKL